MPPGYLASSNGGTSNSSASSTSSASGLGLGMSMGLVMGGMGGGHHGPATPPESPNVPISPVHTPPPYDVVVSGSGSGSGASKQLLQKSVSTPMQQEDTTPRLPVFNRLSSAVEPYQQQSNLGL